MANYIIKNTFSQSFCYFFFVAIGPCNFVFQFSLKSNAIGDRFSLVVIDAPFFESLAVINARGLQASIMTQTLGLYWTMLEVCKHPS